MEFEIINEEVNSLQRVKANCIESCRYNDEGLCRGCQPTLAFHVWLVKIEAALAGAVFVADLAGLRAEAGALVLGVVGYAVL